jgi:hypothetical protein
MQNQASQVRIDEMMIGLNLNNVTYQPTEANLQFENANLNENQYRMKPFNELGLGQAS